MKNVHSCHQLLLEKVTTAKKVQQKRSFAASVQKLLLSKPILYKRPTID